MLVSIIIPVYNTEKYLPRCIESVLGQSYKDIELLLVDDGSTDGSGAICDQYAADYPQIRAFHKNNGGASSARNLGLTMARGEWISFMDSDDLLLDDGLQTLIDGISSQVNMVMAGYEVYDENNHRIQGLPELKEMIISDQDCLKLMHYPKDFEYLGFVTSKLYKRDCIMKYGCTFDSDIFYNEDRLFIVRYICSAKGSVFYSTTPVYRYSLRPNSLMGIMRESFNQRFFTVLTAAIRMSKIVSQNYPNNTDLQRIYHHAIYYSYRDIIWRLKEFGLNKPLVIKRIRKECIQGIGIFLYFYEEIKRNIRRINKLLKRILWENPLF